MTAFIENRISLQIKMRRNESQLPVGYQRWMLHVYRLERLYPT